MAGTVDLPAIGKTKSVYVWGGAAVVVVIVGYAYIHHRNSAAASGSSAAAAATLDPATGYPSGSPEDMAALDAQSGSGAYSGAGGGYAGYGTGYGAQQYYYDPADGLYDLTSPYTGSSNGAGSANTGPGTFSDNAYWVQYAEQNVQGYTPTQVQGALSAYLAGLGLTTTQMSIYQASIAVAGEPPHPPKNPAHLQNGTGHGGGGSGTPGHVTVPGVVGQPQEAAFAIISEAGLHPEGSPVVKGKTLIVRSQSPADGHSAVKGSTVTLHSTAAAPKKK